MSGPAGDGASRSSLVTAAAWLTAAALIVGRTLQPTNAALAAHAPVVVVGTPPLAVSVARHAPDTTRLASVARAEAPAAGAVAAAPAPRRTLPRPFAAKPARGAADSAARTTRYLATRLLSPRIIVPRLPAIKGLMTRARPGEPVQVTLTAYCLKGTTRRGLPVREGIVAADPRVFPLARHVEIYSDGRFLGRFLVDDTGGVIKGPTIDIWTPSCEDARRFGRRQGTASLVVIDAD